MSAWWTYRPSDFLLFSARTYYRLFELHNAALWPAHVLMVGLGLALALALWTGRESAPRTACALLAACWLGVAWAFHWQRFAAINWVAPGYAMAFAAEGVLLAAWAATGPGAGSVAPHGTRRRIGLALWLLALLQPAAALGLGRPWRQAEWFGIAPDPTVLATLGLLLLLPAHPGRGTRAARAAARASWLLWPIPLLWCAVTGTTLATLNAADAWLLPLAAACAVMTAWRSARIGP